ncbi:hypothetical protein Q9L58_009450 [Maublancomyces gigas]|uniref:Uncharacterized protein n=1 Tax=Discina gigas TaxID=1032678 RepID=A0ABR3G6X8_9PEZI
MRSAGALCGVRRLPASERRIPDDVAMKAQRLLWVYGKPGPEFMFVIKVPGVDDKNDDGDNEDDDMVDPMGDAERSTLSPPQAGPSRRPARLPIRPPAPHSGGGGGGGGGGPATMDTATVINSSRGTKARQAVWSRSSCKISFKATKGSTGRERVYDPKATAQDVSLRLGTAGG